MRKEEDNLPKIVLLDSDEEEKQKEPTPKQSFLVRAFLLTVLSVTTASVVLLTWYVRTRRGPMFVSSTAVVMAEVAKVVTSLLVTLTQDRQPLHTAKTIYGNTCGNVKEWLETSLPAFLYVIQNNLIFFALSNLDTTIYQVTYQLKILSTAFFSLLILKTSLSHRRWVALNILFMGVAIAQYKVDNSSSTKSEDRKSRILGLLAVLCASLLSGFSSVYLEKMFKVSEVTIWIRNIQMGSFGTAFAIIGMISKDWDNVISGFFAGYDIYVWILIFLQSSGGLMVALVMKYTDSIIKTFAMAVSIMISYVFSYIFFNTQLEEFTLLGAALVCIAIVLYGLPKIE